MKGILKGDIERGKLEKKLGEFGIKIFGDYKEMQEGGLVLSIVDMVSYKVPRVSYLTLEENPNVLKIITPANAKSRDDANMFMFALNGLNHSLSVAYVRGPENLAFYAAKIMSLYNPEIAKQLKDMAQKKKSSYELRSMELCDFK